MNGGVAARAECGLTAGAEAAASAEDLRSFGLCSGRGEGLGGCGFFDDGQRRSDGLKGSRRLRLRGRRWLRLAQGLKGRLDRPARNEPAHPPETAAEQQRGGCNQEEEGLWMEVSHARPSGSVARVMVR